MKSLIYSKLFQKSQWKESCLQLRVIWILFTWSNVSPWKTHLTIFFLKNILKNLTLLSASLSQLWPQKGVYINLWNKSGTNTTKSALFSLYSCVWWFETISQKLNCSDLKILCSNKCKRLSFLLLILIEKNLPLCWKEREIEETTKMWGY